MSGHPCWLRPAASFLGAGASVHGSLRKLRSLLRARGVGPEQLVGVCVDRSIQLVVAMLGVLKAGGAFLPLCPTDRAERLRHMVSDSGVRLVLCDSPASTPIPSEDVELFEVDKLRLVAETGRVAPLVEPDNLASVIYMPSARPNPVAITHASIVNFLRGMTKRLGRTQLPFDLAILEALAAKIAAH
jgi:non-ribosomal peptide synthetase component F